MTELNFVERIGLKVLRRRIDRAESHIHEAPDLGVRSCNNTFRSIRRSALWRALCD